MVPFLLKCSSVVKSVKKEIWVGYHLLNWCIHVYFFSPGRHLVLLLLSWSFRLHSSRLSCNSSCKPKEKLLYAAAPLHSYPVSTPVRVTLTWPAQCLLCTLARLHVSSIFLVVVFFLKRSVIGSLRSFAQDFITGYQAGSMLKKKNQFAKLICPFSRECEHEVTMWWVYHLVLCCLLCNK